MSWLLIDDGFTEHPKLIQLGGPQARWAWLELLAYCARRKTGGRVPHGVSDVLRRVTPAFLERAHSVGLLDRDEHGFIVHDWDHYNGRDRRALQAERARRYRQRHAKERDAGVTSGVIEALPERDIRRDETVTRAQGRARVPHPHPIGDDVAPLGAKSSSPPTSSPPTPQPPSADDAPPDGSASAEHGDEEPEPDPEGLRRIAELTARAASNAATENPYRRNITSPTVKLDPETLAEAERRQAASRAALERERQESHAAS